MIEIIKNQKVLFSVIILLVLLTGLFVFINFNNKENKVQYDDKLEEQNLNNQKIEKVKPIKDFLCLAISKNDVSLCQNLNNQSTISSCIQDVNLFSLNSINCEDLEVGHLKEICKSIKNQDDSYCADDTKIMCKALINNNKDDCNDYEIDIDVEECKNLFNIIKLEKKEDCTNLKKIGNNPIDWKFICGIKFSKELALCVLN